MKYLWDNNQFYSEFTSIHLKYKLMCVCYLRYAIWNKVANRNQSAYSLHCIEGCEISKGKKFKKKIKRKKITTILYSVEIGNNENMNENVWFIIENWETFLIGGVVNGKW